MVIILTALFNIFSFFHINEYAIDKLLLDKTAISFRIYSEDKYVSESDFLKKIENFSQKSNVEIAQYSYLSSDNIDIYSTRKDEYKEALFIPTYIFNRDIKVHDFESILDVGFKNILYVDTKDMDIIQDLMDELQNVCELYYSESEFKDGSSLSYPIVNYMDVNYLSIFIIFISGFVLILFFYYSRCRQQYIIYRLWGYTYIQIYYMLNKFFYTPFLLTIVLSNLAMSGIIYKFAFSNLLLEILFLMMVLNIAIVLLVFLLSIALFSVSFVTAIHNRKKGLSKLAIIAYISKFLLLLLIFFFSENLMNQKAELDKKSKSLMFWNDTQNLFILNETYSPFNYDSLASENILNEKIYNVYKDLSDLDKVFIMNTLNYEHLMKENISTDNEDDYNYHVNVKCEEDLYSPYGKNITVDINYIKKHTIKAVGIKNIIDLIDENDDVLNILVPQKYKDHEEYIENSYKEWFYFQKVDVPNLYREDCNQTKIEKNIEDLKINIIYIENNQRYFTYNLYSGNSMNTIEDPIITVYTENIDNSYLGSCLGSYMFIEAKDQYSALEEINPITQKYNLVELNSVSSVYDCKGEEIKNLEESIDILVQNTLIISLLLIMLMVVITYAYYMIFFSPIIIKSLYGHCFTYIYKHLIFANLFINLSIIPLLAISYKKISLYMIIIITMITVMDCLVARIINRTLLTRGELQFIKGEFK